MAGVVRFMPKCTVGPQFSQFNLFECVPECRTEIESYEIQGNIFPNDVTLFNPLLTPQNINKKYVSERITHLQKPCNINEDECILSVSYTFNEDY